MCVFDICLVLARCAHDTRGPHIMGPDYHRAVGKVCRVGVRAPDIRVWLEQWQHHPRLVQEANGVHQPRKDPTGPS